MSDTAKEISEYIIANKGMYSKGPDAFLKTIGEKWPNATQNDVLDAIGAAIAAFRDQGAEHHADADTLDAIAFSRI